MNELADEFYEKAIVLMRHSTNSSGIRKMIRLFKKADKLGSLNATVYLGMLYETGYYIKKDLEKSKCLFQKAANEGDRFGEFNLGRLLYHERKYEEAISWWMKAITKNETHSKVFLGIAYEKGHGVEKNIEKAIEFFRSAEIDGDPDAFCQLALCYRDGLGVEKNTEKMNELITKAREKDHPYAWELTGNMYLEGMLPAPDPIQSALECYEKAASFGEVNSQVWCGEYYTLGPSDKRNHKKGVKFLEYAIKAGDPRAKYLKSVLMALGMECKKNPKAAYLLCKEAASDGERDAQHMLGLMLQQGDGVKENISKAIYWFEKAASQGHEKARERLKSLD